MKPTDKIPTRCLVLTVCVLILTASSASGADTLRVTPPERAADRGGSSRTVPTLARLSFWVPPARMAEFEAAYEAKVLPILKRHGLTPSSERGRATPDSIFSRLFEMKTPSEVADKQKAFQGDSTWTAALQGLGARFGAPDSLVRSAFGIYVAPAGPGKVVPAGRGTGYWRIYDVTDGLGG